MSLNQNYFFILKGTTVAGSIMLHNQNNDAIASWGFFFFFLENLQIIQTNMYFMLDHETIIRTFVL